MPNAGATPPTMITTYPAITQHQGLLALLCVALWIGAVWTLAKRGAWNKLAHRFPTDLSYIPVGRGPLYTTSAIINGRRYKGSYTVPRDEGVLFYFGLFRIFYPSFLIPWSELKDMTSKPLPIVKIEVTTATVRTMEGAFEIRLPQYVVDYGKNLGHW